jgi:DNA-binding transcriptional ArsR family regulator
VNAFDILGDPIRRRILELLARSELTSGEIVGIIGEEFGVTQPAVSQHLRALRDSGFATVRADGARRHYSLDVNGLEPVDSWLSDLRGFWEQHLDALSTEVARGKRNRGLAGNSDRSN